MSRRFVSRFQKEQYQKHLNLAKTTQDRVTPFAALLTALVSLVLAYLAWHTDLTTREALLVVQRPFVTVTGLQIGQESFGASGPTTWTFAPIVQNSGSTPTKDMQYVSAVSGVQPGDPEDAFQRPVAPFERHRATLGPHYNGPLLGGWSGLPFSVVKEMADNRSPYFIYGAIHYRDQFAESEEHISKFCFVVQASVEQGMARPGYDPCVFWNCTDEDCKTDREAYYAEVARLLRERQKQ
jgi:hypothetical protein